MAKLPPFIPPMLAKIGQPFSSDEHLFEIKWDGTRAVALIEDGDYRLLNRKRRSRREAYPELAFLAKLPSGTALDGEIVVMVDDKPDFSGMLRREQATDARRIRALVQSLPAAYVVFDLLWRGGAPIMERPLEERRAMLRGLVEAAAEPRLVLSEGVVGDGSAFFEEVCRRELEGVVAKRLGSRYLPGKRSDAWLKIKRTHRVYCAVIGFLPDGDDLKSLLVAVEDGGELRYAGRVGSGWSAAKRGEVNALVRSRVRAAPLIPCPVAAQWVEPGLYCTVDYLERTETGEMRAPVFVDMVGDEA